MIAMLIYSLFQSTAQSACIKADGIAVIQQNGQLLTNIRFSMLHDGHNYLITLHYDNGEVIETGTDGEAAFTVNRMTSAFVNSTNRVYHVAEITPSTFPANGMLPAQLLWLLTRPDVARAAQVPGFEFSRQFTNNISVEVARDSIDINNVKWYGPNYNRIRGDNIVLPYTNGWLVASLQISKRTNLNNLTFPLDFEYTSHRPSYQRGVNPKSRDEVNLVTRQSYSVTNIHAIVAERFLPLISWTTIAHDHRHTGFGFTNSVSYKITHKGPGTMTEWIPKSDSRIRAVVYGPERQQLRSGIWRWFLVFCICICPLIILGMNSWLPRKTKKIT